MVNWGQYIAPACKAVCVREHGNRECALCLFQKFGVCPHPPALTCFSTAPCMYCSLPPAQAFAAFNAVQYTEAVRIKQAKQGEARREISANLTWRSPAAERNAPFRPGERLIRSHLKYRVCCRPIADLHLRFRQSLQARTAACHTPRSMWTSRICFGRPTSR